jgi:predicted RNA-binding protein Jag
MNASQKKYFSGDTLRQALVQAANHFSLDPNEIAYRPIEKKHGFIKNRKKVLIEVDSAAPKRTGPAPQTIAPPPAPAAPAPALATPVAPVVSPPPAPPLPPMSAATPIPAPPAPIAPAPRTAAPRSDRADRPAERRPPEPRPTPPPRSGQGAEEEDLVTLPEKPLSLTERYPVATGPQADAALQGLTLLLRIAGLDLAPKILQGEERLEIELSGSDTDRCFEEEGEVLRSIEHLLPRIIRAIAGGTIPCRVDCDNFHDIREEQLRTLAQRVAAEVRKRGRFRTLEPMNPADRRVVHMTLADDPGVVTESEGEGYFKRVSIRPA